MLNKIEYKSMVDLIKSINTPRRYNSLFYYKFLNYKILSIKIHNYHKLLHNILPIAIIGMLTSNIYKIVYYLEALF